MARYRPVTKFILTRDHDIQGKAWRKGDIVHGIEVVGSTEPKWDLFLTHKSEYAKRGSRAPVHRTLTKYLLIDGENLTINEPEETDDEEPDEAELAQEAAGNVLS